MNKKLLRKKLALMLANLKKKRPYYCEVEYLESTGTQYINTGLLSTANSKVDCVFGFSSMESGVANNVAVFGGRSASQYTHNTFTFFKLASQNPQRFRFDYNNQQYVGSASNMTWNTTSKYRMSYDGSSVRVANITTDQSAQETMTPDTVFTTQPIYLFAVNTMGNAQMFMSGRIYKYWYTDGTNTIDFIPVLDWNYVPCFYDKVSGQLFYNAGTGNFTAGREIHYVDYLESTGTQYILTGFTPTVNTDFELELSSTSTGTNNWAMGCPTWVGVHYKGATNEVGITNSSTAAFQQYISYNHDDSKLTMKLSGDTVYANGVSLGTITRRAGTLDFALFGYRDANQGATILFKGSIYKTKICDNNTLVRDFVPAIDENGVGFMLDKVSHTCFLNQGTGVFKYPAREVEYLESTGTQYIDTGVIYNTTDTFKIVQDIQGVSGAVQKGSGWGAGGGLVYQGTTPKWDTGNSQFQTNGFDFTTRITGIIEITGSSSSYSMTDGTNTYTATRNNSLTSYAKTTGYPLMQITANNGVMNTGLSSKLYDSEIFINNIIVRDFIPSFQDGVSGMLDKKNNVFYQNAGTGTFSVGKIIEPEYE